MHSFFFMINKIIHKRLVFKGFSALQLQLNIHKLSHVIKMYPLNLNAVIWSTGGLNFLSILITRRINAETYSSTTLVRQVVAVSFTDWFCQVFVCQPISRASTLAVHCSCIRISFQNFKVFNFVSIGIGAKISMLNNFKM